MILRVLSVLFLHNRVADIKQCQQRLFIDMSTNIKTALPLIDFTLLNTFGATLECPAGSTLAGPRAPAATLAQQVTNMPLFF